MTDIIQIDAGTLIASSEERTITGLLVPYNEDCRSNLGKFSVAPGAFEIPNDLSGMSLNIEHQREEVRGQFVSARDTAEGIVATFSIANTPEGDAALADVENGLLKHLSAEVANVVIKAGKAISGRLFAAALVAVPAFPSATLLAAAADTLDPTVNPTDPNAPVDPNAPAAPVDPNAAPTETQSVQMDEFTDANGVTWTRKRTEDVVVDGTTTTITTTEVIEEPPTPAPTNQGDTMSNTASVPGSLQASAVVSEPTQDLSPLFASISEAAKTKNTTMLAALEDVKMTGTGSLEDAIAPNFVGELWSGRRYQRRVAPLLGSGTLTSHVITGYRFDDKPEVAAWAGNKAAIPSNVPTVTPYNVEVQAFAGGWDIDRRFFDFGQTAVIESLIRYAVDDYAKKSDNYALEQVLLEATSAAVGTIPTDVAPALVKLVDGALRIVQEDALPTFAVMAPDVYRELALIKERDILAFLSASLGLEAGNFAGFSVVPHAGLDEGQVLVGSREAASFLELGGSPIRVNAVEIAKGGLDEAIFGYAAVRIDYPQALQLVTDAA